MWVLEVDALAVKGPSHHCFGGLTKTVVVKEFVVDVVESNNKSGNEDKNQQESFRETRHEMKLVALLWARLFVGHGFRSVHIALFLPGDQGSPPGEASTEPDQADEVALFQLSFFFGFVKTDGDGRS